MILLSGHSLKESRRVPLESMSLSLKERQSTAQMTPADMTGIGTDSWFLDDTQPGAGIVWRVKSIQTAYSTDTQTVQLEHVINTLRDRILFGETTPATITGNGTAQKCTAEQAVRHILSKQSDWVLGNFGFSSVSNNYKFDGESLYDALEKVTKTLKDAWWSYDLTKYPFRLNITAKQSGVTSELRPGRNLVTITRTIDKTGMYTRFYPIGKDDLHISGNYVSRNEKAYGVIEKVECDQSRTTEAELRAWANEKLDMHAEPQVNIEVDGLELADATGEGLDRLNLGRICRIPLTEFDTTIEERITELNYRDKVFEPENVKITLANPQEDVTQLIADEIKEGGGTSGRAARGSSRQSKEDHAWIEDTDEHVALCAEGIIGKDKNGNPNWVRLSQLVVDGEGIHSMVQDVQEDVVNNTTRIEQNETAIELMAESYDEQLGNLSGKINVAAGQIDQVVKAVGDDGKVTAASICLAITRAGSKAAITADHITLGTNKLSNILLVTGQGVGIQKGVITPNVILQTGTTHFASLQNAIVKATVTGTVLTLENAKGETVTFDKAAASPRLSGSWSNGKLTVTSTPSAQANYERLLAQDEVEWADDYLSCTAPILAKFGSSGQYTEETGWRVYINTTAAWDAGYDAVPKPQLTASWSNGKLTVTSYPAAVQNLERLLGTDTVEWAQDYKSAQIPIITRWGSSGQYTESTGYKAYINTSDAWNAGYAAVPRPQLSGTWSNGKLTVTSSPAAVQNLERLLGTDTVEWASDYKSAQIPIITRWGSGGQYSESTGYKAYINTTDAWNAGYAAVPRPQLSGSWSNGKLTVTSSPAAVQNLERLLVQGSPSWAGDYMSVTVPVNAQYGSGGQYSEATGLNVWVDTSACWWDGYNSAPQTTYYSRNLYCSSVEHTYPGSSTYYYYFRLEGNYSFSSGSTYTMYRQSW